MIKNLIKELKKDNEYIENNIFKSAFNVNLSTVLGYHKDDEVHCFLDDYDENKS